MKHTPEIRLSAAYRARDFARQECPHWDQENEHGDTLHECCYELDDAKRELARARVQAAK